MTVDQAVAQVINYVDNVSSADAGNSNRLTRVLNYLQEVYEDIWHTAEWAFRWKLFTVSISANATSGTLGTTFSDLPSESNGGQVFNSATNQRLRIVRPSEIIELQQAPGGTITSNPLKCAVFGQEASTPYSQLLQIQKTSVALTLNVWGHVKPTVHAAGGDTLNQLPYQWHQSVLIPGMRAKAQKSKGDIKEWMSEYERGLARMLATENQIKGANFTMPGFFGY